MLYLSGKMGVMSFERMLWILNTSHHRRTMKNYNSLENVNSKKTVQPPKNLQRKTYKKDRGMTGGHEEGRRRIHSAFKLCDRKSWEQQF